MIFILLLVQYQRSISLFYLLIIKGNIMKKNLKCLTALCMAGAMISLTGCGSSSQSTSADTTAGSASSEATTSAESTASGNGSKTHACEYLRNGNEHQCRSCL